MDSTTEITELTGRSSSRSATTPPPEAVIRAAIRRDLPADTFTPQPWRALWFVPLVAIVIGSIVAQLALSPMWPVRIVIALVMGQAMAALGFLAHEALHGSLVQSRRLQTVLGYCGFGPMLVSPALWRVWHNQVHHNRTNMGNSDPDGFGTMARYERMPSTRFVAQLAPGSGHPLSFLFLGYWFAFHGQVVLWLQSRYMRGFESLNRRRAILDSVVGLLAWGALAYVAGPFVSLFVVAIPFVTANATVMSYISTNHFMRPLAETNNPVENSMSVNTLPVIDAIHFNFSHHVEHHLFPKMSAKHAPRVREWLLENQPDDYLSPAHWMAVRELYRTPRVYLDATTLVNPSDLTRQVSTERIAEFLSA